MTIRCACCGQPVPVDRQQVNGLPERRRAEPAVEYRRRAADEKIPAETDPVT